MRSQQQFNCTASKHLFTGKCHKKELPCWEFQLNTFQRIPAAYWKAKNIHLKLSKLRRWTFTCIRRTCDTRCNDSFSVQRSAVISLSGVVCQCWTSSEPAQIVGEKRLWHLWRVSICITSVVGPVPLIHKTSRKDKATSLCASVRSRSSCERVKREKLPCRWAESGRILHWRW